MTWFVCPENRSPLLGTGFPARQSCREACELMKRTKYSLSVVVKMMMMMMMIMMIILVQVLPFGDDNENEVVI